MLRYFSLFLLFLITFFCYHQTNKIETFAGLDDCVIFPMGKIQNKGPVPLIPPEDANYKERIKDNCVNLNNVLY